MKSVHLRSFACALVAIVGVAATATAQTGSPILTSLDVQKLVASTDPADNARLSAHFGALAERYAREATRHEGMAQSFAAAPTRRTPANTAAEPRQLRTCTSNSPRLSTRSAKVTGRLRPARLRCLGD